MSYTIALYVERDEKELELKVTGSVSSYFPAVTHLRPEDCHPAEGGEVEIEKITLNTIEWNGELTDIELERAEESLTEAASNNDYYFDDSDPPDDHDDEIIDYPEHY